MMDEMEMMMSGEDPWAWMDLAERNHFAASTVLMGLGALAAAITPALIWHLYLMDETKRRGVSSSSAPNYINAWNIMWIGGLASFGPAALMWPFSYVDSVASSIYGWCWTWAEGMGMLSGFTVIAFLLV